MSRPPCRYINSPGGCRRGKDCHFAHTLTSKTANTRPFSPSSASSDGSSHPNTQRPNASGSPLPKGVCRFFWEHGRCSREFECRYEHTSKAEGSSRTGPRSTITPSEAVLRRLAPFLTEEGLSKMNGSGTDGFFSQDPSASLSPSEAHNALKRFLQDNFRFRSTFEVYAFLKPLNSANASNTHWTQEHGQLLLNTMSSQNGLLRLVDIFRWPQVSAHAGSSRDILSFQRGILPVLRYLSSDFVIKSTLLTRTNTILAELLQNLSHLADVIEASMAIIMNTRSFKDPGGSGQDPQIGAQVLASTAGVLHECLVRFKNAVAMYPRLATLATNLRLWFDQWTAGISSLPPTFDNPFQGVDPAVRDLLIGGIREKIERIGSIVERELGKETRSDSRRSTSTYSYGTNEGVIAALHASYDPPGELRLEGPRHDNDLLDIADIRVAPTHEELMCRIPPFLPASLFAAPHHAPPESMERLLDIQFRLLREELMAPLRRAVQLVHDDIKVLNRSKTKLGEILQKGGGKYHGLADSQESVMFNVYPEVVFSSLVPDHRGLSASLSVQTPPGRASSPQVNARVAFWKGMSSKRLAQGGLIALVWATGHDVSVHLGVVASSLEDLTEYVRQDRSRVKIRIVFFDSKVELRILAELRNRRSSSDGIKILVESPVMLEAIRPFLEALKREPEVVPFPRYLVFHPPGYLNTCTVDPPKYARLPRFTFQLSSLFPKEAEVEDLQLNVSDEVSIQHTRAELHRASRLDPSQADAVVDALTREVALIQGPPGTGKSYTGVELLRVLIANRVGPILMIALTNHALDHMLCSVLDANITNNIVRLGSRSADERISQYSIETREMVAGQSRLNRTFASHYRELKIVQGEITQLMNRVLNADLESDSVEIVKYLQTFHPEHHEFMSHPPEWIRLTRQLLHDDPNDGWKTQGRGGRSVKQDTSIYAYWKNSGDLEFLEMSASSTSSFSGVLGSGTKHLASSHVKFFEALISETSASTSDTDSIGEDEGDESDDETPLKDLKPEERWMAVPVIETPDSDSDSDTKELHDPPTQPAMSEPAVDTISAYVDDPAGLFAALGEDGIPSVPSGDRPLDELLDIGEVWAMSRCERKRLHGFWIEQARIQMHQNQLDEFERLRKLYAERVEEYNEGKEAARRDLLHNVDIIGCTTTGAAKLATLLRSLGPRVLLVEEAGQVLEAHVLGSLVPSVEHLILIGDPLQLRPTLNNYSLSMDSRRGQVLYRFDMSLMERLAVSGLPMSQIDVQRRMRPMISSLIRNTLYPKLEDHELVTQYPDVRGMEKNMFFVTHNHKENGGMDDTASKYNTYEVNMIRDLVLYLLRQGCYSSEGDIVVLCAYLGQLARLRDALGGEVAVIIDERDQAALDDHEGDKDDKLDDHESFEHVKVTKQVRLRTIDNYQGEEGKIVILSLVRNSGGLEDDFEQQGMTGHAKPNIGFLKSENRTNVALSRAREGLFIFGNAENLSSRSRMWRSIIEELQTNDAIGPGFPVACHRHPEQVRCISQPGQLTKLAPDGGCMEPCDTKLRCGHLCPFKCHCDDPNHVSVVCTRPCRRLCHRDHPCRKDCNSPCGDCMFPVNNVKLPCGHVKNSVPCYQLEAIENIYCNQEVVKALPRCEHTASMPCSQEPEHHRCLARCTNWMTCCSKSCNASCYQCQASNPQPDEEGAVKRIKHLYHSCEKRLYCEHPCQQPCSDDHEHTMRCTAKCRQVCSHTQCNRECSFPCAPCKQPCTWTCPHYICPVPCGSVCARFPCDRRCEKTLACGHRCSSVCGEDCKIQVCPLCAPDEQKAQVVDFIMQRTLSEVTPDDESLDEMLITIPSCRHAFTVETLDGHCGMSEFYSRGPDGRWCGLLTPTGFKRPPTCPTCRTAITAPRYGRIFKRADLDILERNVAAQMSRSLARVQGSVESLSIPSKKEQLVQAAATINLKFTASSKKQQRKALERVLRTTKEAPISHGDINPANKDLHSIDGSVMKVWSNATQQLLSAYKEAVQIAETRSAHTDAWEAALSCLHEREVAALLANSSSSARQPMEHAMEVARMQVGQLRPLADRRFLVEAIWSTIHIRLSLADLMTTWLDEVSKRMASNGMPFHSQQLSWASYIRFLFAGCLRDAQVALDVATDSESHRQITKTVLYQMRISLEEYRFNLFMAKTTGTFKVQGSRDVLAERASQMGRESRERMYVAIQQHHDKKMGLEEMDWLKENFTSIARDIVQEWRKIELSIRMDTFYQPVSLDERMAIVKALDFAHAGHYYNCPNGHTFVITECGGAMEVGRCPECNASIGGSHHRLDPSNTRNVEFEELARQVGGSATPWQRPW
ncbi:hypothetical protein PAXRUDRAFT_828683 [Paxillus rubicundulus Ve08.2h10]|uniref:Unplaced genomic scaffold scaffold_340, whole genome shotgun sequence n=1 Tax=Paxillus rubicundulus Ve08.2h10 TaxID=930991 RepID=A0A0D0DVT2_9AGAM|nr:hypothetical protein PAXRUDRAFT_828683 [Paxillus rubicundulus Ve08.2h10]